MGAGADSFLVVPHHGRAWLRDARAWSVQPRRAVAAQAVRLVLAPPRRDCDGAGGLCCGDRRLGDDRGRAAAMDGLWLCTHRSVAVAACRAGRGDIAARVRDRLFPRVRRGYRSEEHKSELQSLMRISYAVFCLKKKNKKSRHT